jgi:hypothetical protein
MICDEMRQGHLSLSVSSRVFSGSSCSLRVVSVCCLRLCKLPTCVLDGCEELPAGATRVANMACEYCLQVPKPSIAPVSRSKDSTFSAAGAASSAARPSSASSSASVPKGTASSSSIGGGNVREGTAGSAVDPGVAQEARTAGAGDGVEMYKHVGNAIEGYKQRQLEKEAQDKLRREEQDRRNKEKTKQHQKLHSKHDPPRDVRGAVGGMQDGQKREGGTGGVGVKQLGVSSDKPKLQGTMPSLSCGRRASTSFSAFLSVCVCLFCLSVCVSSVCLSHPVFLFFRTHIHTQILPVCIFPLSIRLSIHASIHPSVYLYIIVNGCAQRERARERERERERLPACQCRPAPYLSLCAACVYGEYRVLCVA